MYLGDLAANLGESGHHQQASRRAEINLASYPDDWWVMVTCGQAFASFDPVRAEKHFREALDLVRARDDWEEIDEALDHLVRFLRDQPGRAEDADAAVREQEEWNLSRGRIKVDIPLGPRRAAPKVGRNQPCPCGSGRKYKRCCGK